MQLSSKYTRGLTFVNFLLGYDPRERILSRHRSRQLIAQRATPPALTLQGVGLWGVEGIGLGEGGGALIVLGLSARQRRVPRLLRILRNLWGRRLLTCQSHLPVAPSRHAFPKVLLVNLVQVLGY